MTLQKNADGRTFLIATPEKALMDVFTLRFQNSDRPTREDISMAIEEDLRIELPTLRTTFRKETLLQYQPHYKNRLWNKLVLQFLLETL